MTNKAKMIFRFLTKLIFFIFKGIFFFFTISFFCLFLLDLTGKISMDWHLFFSYEYMYKIIVAGFLLGIAAWWVKTFGSESKKNK